MSIDYETSEGLRFLNGLEEGNLETTDVYNIAEKRDPVLVYFIIRYLREKYPATQPASAGVVGRIVSLTSDHDDIVKMSREGEQDSMREWFDDAYEMREFFNRPEEFVRLIVDKLES